MPKTISVKELIELLSKENPENSVWIYNTPNATKQGFCCYLCTVKVEPEEEDKKE